LKPKHWIVFITLGLIWSSSFLWIKIGVQEIGPMALVAYRMLFGALTAILIAMYQKVQWPRDWKTWGIYAILGPTSLAIPIFFISWGEQAIDSAVASILNATVPLFTIVIAHFWLHDDKMTVQKALGLLIGFAGVVVLLSEDLLTSSHNSVIGQAAVILAALFYAWSSVFARRTTQHVDGHHLSLRRFLCGSSVPSLRSLSCSQLCPLRGLPPCGWVSLVQDSLSLCSITCFMRLVPRVRHSSHISFRWEA
jgi:drug/metabolite transporter (DMT)-like permease